MTIDARDFTGATIHFSVPTEIQFDHDSWLKEPLPGSELAVLHLARALAKFHYSVVVSGPVRVEGEFEGVTFCRVRNVKQAQGTQKVNVVVRDYWAAGAREARKKNLTLLWAQDTFEEIEILSKIKSWRALRAQFLRFDGLIVPSVWHKENILLNLDLNDNQLPTLVSPPPIPHLSLRNPQRRSDTIIHTAHPRKAVVPTLQAFRKLRRLRPNASLTLCGSEEIYQETGNRPVGSLMLELAVDVLDGDLSGVRLSNGSHPQIELLRRLGAHTIMLHPCTMEETGATVVVEAMAMGCVPVVSDLGCLPELCNGRGEVVPRSSRTFTSDIAARASELLESPARLQALREAGTAFVERFCRPEQVAENLITFLTRIASQVKDGTKLAAKVSKRSPISTFSKPRVVIAEEISKSSWGSFVKENTQASFTHTRFWCMSVEKQISEIESFTFGVRGADGTLLGLLPLTRLHDSEDSKFVSGVLEPSGPLLNASLSAGQAETVVSVMTEYLGALSETASAKKVLVKNAIISYEGNRTEQKNTERYLRLLGYAQEDYRLFVARLNPKAVHLGLKPSRRLREQLRHARVTGEVRAVQTKKEMRAFLVLYETCMEEQQYAAFVRPETIETLKRGSHGVQASLYLVMLSDSACGYSFVLRYGKSAALHAWNVNEAGKEHHLAKLLVWESIVRELDRGVTNVEYGGYDGARPRGIGEFYRRIGGVECAPSFFTKYLSGAMEVSSRYRVR